MDGSTRRTLILIIRTNACLFILSLVILPFVVYRGLAQQALQQKRQDHIQAVISQYSTSNVVPIEVVADLLKTHQGSARFGFKVLKQFGAMLVSFVLVSGLTFIALRKGMRASDVTA